MKSNEPNGVSGNLPCDEGDLLAWIEGETLAAGRAAAVARALSRDPALAARAERMKADRLSMRALGDVRCPTGLVEAVSRAVESTLERRMLLGLEREAPVEALPRATTVRVRRPSPVWAVFAHRSTWGLAAAAAFLLIVGGGVYWAIIQAPPGITGPIARGPETPEPITLKGTEEADGASLARAPVVEATTTEEAQPAESGSTLASADVPAAPPPAPDSSTPVREMALATALELAREGRLVVVVEARTPGEATKRIDALAARGSGGGTSSWRVMPEVPSAIAAMITTGTVAPAVVRREGSYDQPIVAGVRHAVPFRPYFIQVPGPAPIVREADRVYLAESRLDEAALGSMLATLAAGDGWEARFQAAPEAVADTCDVLTPSSVFWWAQPPSGWVEWAAVPVVVRRAPVER